MLFGLSSLLILPRWNLNLTDRFRRNWIFAGCILMGLFVSWRTTHNVVPGYAKEVSIVNPCLQMAALAEKEGIPYAAYRNSWDAISFQLNRGELTVISSREQNQLNEWLMSHPRCLIWMREHDHRPTEFASHLPAGVEIERAYDLGKIEAFILKTSTNTASTSFISR
jgi:hypothetical protein